MEPLDYNFANKAPASQLRVLELFPFVGCCHALFPGDAKLYEEDPLPWELRRPLAATSHVGMVRAGNTIPYASLAGGFAMSIPGPL